jgi:hypothetical protein
MRREYVSEWMFDARDCFNGVEKVVVGQDIQHRC